MRSLTQKDMDLIVALYDRAKSFPTPEGEDIQGFYEMLKERAYAFQQVINEAGYKIQDAFEILVTYTHSEIEHLKAPLWFTHIDRRIPSMVISGMTTLVELYLKGEIKDELP